MPHAVAGPVRPVLTLAALLALAAPGVALASPNAGGATSDGPDVSALKCGTGASASCPRGQVLRLSGEGLAATRAVTFLGGPGARDDRSVRPRERSSHRVIVAVPRTAHSGRIQVRTATARVTGPRLRVLTAPRTSAASASPPATAADDGGVFPVRGKHEYGSGTNRFGGGRGHQGQDVFAACGTPLVAARAGTVRLATFQERAGNYVVVDAPDGTSQAYMHLQAPAGVARGDAVAAGQPLGRVGQTGRATGCHLHFELWTGGWQSGGRPIDPLPALKRWDAAGAEG